MKYVAFLRGINVSGQKLIKMTDLARMFEDMGFANVSTYIQSGNVLFDSKAQSDSLEKKIEKGLAKELGYEVPVVVRSITELRQIVKKTPFKDVQEPDKTVSIYVAFLKEEPEGRNIEELMKFCNKLETFVDRGKDMYILNHRDKGKLMFTNTWLEKKLKVAATTRNWNTVKKLAGL
jgi:uncharacterized protein (DUF1697 family)